MSAKCCVSCGGEPKRVSWGRGGGVGGAASCVYGGLGRVSHPTAGILLRKSVPTYAIPLPTKVLFKASAFLLQSWQRGVASTHPASRDASLAV